MRIINNHSCVQYFATYSSASVFSFMCPISISALPSSTSPHPTLFSSTLIFSLPSPNSLVFLFQSLDLSSSNSLLSFSSSLSFLCLHPQLSIISLPLPHPSPNSLVVLSLMIYWIKKKKCAKYEYNQNNYKFIN